jgi:LacI family transcriptional regulator
MSLVGFDNVFFTRYFRPRLSTINNPIGEMGRMAARWVLKEVYGEADIEVQFRYEPELVARDSVADLNRG